MSVIIGNVASIKNRLQLSSEEVMGLNGKKQEMLVKQLFMHKGASFCLVAKVPIVSWLCFVCLCQAILWVPFKNWVILACR